MQVSFLHLPSRPNMIYHFFFLFFFFFPFFFPFELVNTHSLSLVAHQLHGVCKGGFAPESSLVGGGVGIHALKYLCYTGQRA